LSKELAAAQGLEHLGVADMIEVQYDQANDTVAGLAQEEKDAADTMKTVSKKIG
jgi:hypothetical protein